MLLSAARRGFRAFPGSQRPLAVINGLGPRRYLAAKASVLGSSDQFINRHIGPRDDDIQDMLKLVGFKTLDELIDSTVPPHIRLDNELKLPDPRTEAEALEELRAIASKNKVYRSFIGMGYYNTFTPGVIQRNVLENPGWYTAYTPYQAEVAQGRLESLLNYQTMICDMTGFAMANASLLDEGTAAAEAMNMCVGATKNKNKFYVAADTHPQTIGVIETRANAIGIEVVVGDVDKLDLDAKDYCGVLVQYPSTYGDIRNYSDLAAKAKASGALVVAAADLLSLAMLKSPAEWGADIAVGSSQRFGVPLFFGGPHAGYLATSDKYSRKMPGRIIGVSIDSNGKRALRMAMQTREQHIRRDKATSNICTAQALLANMAGFYAVYHGPEGIKEIAARVNNATNILAEGIKQAGHEVVTKNFFDTITVKAKGGSAAIVKALTARGINVRPIDDECVGIALDETVTEEDLTNLIQGFGVKNVDLEALANKAGSSIPDALQRKSEFLTHPIFNTYRSETKMMRYIKTLEDKDVGLNRSMIALGSCTMKLNAVSELQPVSWPEFSGIHPFVPEDQVMGYTEMIETLHDALAKITGFAAVSSQPNSGAQGEYAGLMAIRSYHESRGEGHRTVCLIPVSAHGTNPASAVMAGMKVVVVKSDEEGNVDFADLKDKTEKHSKNLAALMITYPSTYGVFEEKVKDMCDLVHEHGGQVYMDGANMNAQVGLTSPGHIGADVCHLNLHKTFCIPHGGGGPGVGSIGVAEHLAPFLPGHKVIPSAGEGRNVKVKQEGAISAAPYGSPGILPIPWMYIRMCGAEGLKKATSVAILNANYMAKRLAPHYEIAFLGSNGQCAHEFIIDIRPLKKFNVSEEDIAKRLQDFGFHSPTMSWPVPGTLMIEPTESEDREELDRLCEALIKIRKEIQDIADGKIEAANSPLTNAPHTAALVMSDKWDRQYSREQAAFPGSWQKGGVAKFWPTVGRVDNVHGDRNLICTCPPLESYAEEAA